eukprot:TRINITY_DN2529_c0_g1_i19.p1 TRINITY_DN2529_c0_g1~~TRINITY_DN2529_c0_g1_i19.p1  ORF type:complete len:351 (-),score=57.88 TRINITY_DN2529_c0_g1_i19:53-1105(-)
MCIRDRTQSTWGNIQVLIKFLRFFMSQTKQIGTHSGTFHADEVLGCVMLTKYTQLFQNANIVRTRDQNILDKLDAVIDVGRIYDASIHRYDHHQGEFNDFFSQNHNIRLSSAGLVFKHFGREVVERIAKDFLVSEKLDIQLSPEDYDQLYLRIYNTFIMPLDATDNGIDAYPQDVEPRYRQTTALEHRVSRLNPTWFEQNIDQDERFREAMKIADDELQWQVRTTMSRVLAKPYVEKAVDQRFNVHESGAIIKLELVCPWKEHLYRIEEEKGIQGQIKYVLFQDQLAEWRIQCVSLSPQSYTNRKSLKSDWCGKSRDEVAQLSGIADVVFVHANGFIGCLLYTSPSPRDS